MAVWTTMGLLHGASSVSAQEPAATSMPPSIELLEFLGAWQTETGQWVDPSVLADDAVDDLLSAASARAASADGQSDDHEK